MSFVLLILDHYRVGGFCLLSVILLVEEYLAHEVIVWCYSIYLFQKPVLRLCSCSTFKEETGYREITC